MTSMVCLAGCPRIGRLHFTAWWNYSTAECSSLSGQSWLSHYRTIRWGWLGDTREPCWVGWRNNLETGGLWFLRKKGDNQLVCYSCVVHHVAMFHFWYRNLFIYSWNQVGIVYEGMKFPLWLDGHNIVKFVVVSSCPEKSVGILLLLWLLTSAFFVTTISFIICIFLVSF